MIVLRARNIFAELSAVVGHSYASSRDSVILFFVVSSSSTAYMSSNLTPEASRIAVLCMSHFSASVCYAASKEEYDRGKDSTNSEGSISFGARSSICDSDSENDICVQPTSVNEVTAQSSSGQGNSTVTFVQAPQRRSIKSIKEESYRQSVAAFPKVPALTLTDNRSTTRHAGIAVSGGKILHRFQQNRFFKKDSTSTTNVGGSVTGSSMCDAFLWSRKKRHSLNGRRNQTYPNRYVSNGVYHVAKD
ncbi:hypothetical protein ACTXT7_002140 [Hymenolepis weldensis]